MSRNIILPKLIFIKKRKGFLMSQKVNKAITDTDIQISKKVLSLMKNWCYLFGISFLVVC